jgi:hypothetical protein
MRLFTFILLLSILLQIPSVFAQKHQDLFTYYSNRKIDQLETRLKQLENVNQNEPEILFFRTILSDDGENAFNVYDRLFKASKGPLKNLAAQKLAEYYYGRGFYVKSSEYKNIAKTYIPLKTSEEPKSGDNTKEYKIEPRSTSIYKIQVGAFGVRENANDLAEYLKDKKLDVSVVRREIDGKVLYCVWVDGESSIDQTEKVAEEIKKNFRLSYRIMKP